MSWLIWQAIRMPLSWHVLLILIGLGLGAATVRDAKTWLRWTPTRALVWLLPRVPTYKSEIAFELDRRTNAQWNFLYDNDRDCTCLSQSERVSLQQYFLTQAAIDDWGMPSSYCYDWVGSLGPLDQAVGMELWKRFVAGPRDDRFDIIQALDDAGFLSVPCSEIAARLQSEIEHPSYAMRSLVQYSMHIGCDDPKSLEAWLQVALSRSTPHVSLLWKQDRTAGEEALAFGAQFAAVDAIAVQARSDQRAVEALHRISEQALSSVARAAAEALTAPAQRDEPLPSPPVSQ